MVKLARKNSREKHESQFFNFLGVLFIDPVPQNTFSEMFQLSSCLVNYFIFIFYQPSCFKMESNFERRALKSVS